MKNSIEILPEKKYQWNQNWPHRVAHTDINLVIEELDAIQSVYGNITPALIVESSKNKKSVLHNYFEWDNSVAADKWRFDQAVKLLGRIEVKTIKDGRPIIMKAYDITSRSGFSETKFVASDSLSEKEVKSKILFLISDLNRIKNKLEQYTQYTQAITHIDEAIKVLSKESTETKNEATPALVAVV